MSTATTEPPEGVQALALALLKLPAQARGPVLVQMEQEFRQKGDLEVLRAIKQYRQANP